MQNQKQHLYLAACNNPHIGDEVTHLWTRNGFVSLDLLGKGHNKPITYKTRQGAQDALFNYRVQNLTKNNPLESADFVLIHKA
jgi:hypothetical protein